MNSEMQTMTIRQIIHLLEDDGWHLIATRGSHRQYKHPIKKGRVTVPGHMSDDLPRGTLNSILKQAQLK
jgi:predicted RNA binding protein YcfA (HicA-like mRNA interferase family)